MIGPLPYRNLPPISSDTKPPAPSVGGVVVPASLKLAREEFVGLAEVPAVEVPSTYDDALRNDKLLSNIDLIDTDNVEVFPSGGTKDEIAFGVLPLKQIDVNAFGGNVGKSIAPSTETKSSSPLTNDEKAVLLQNAVSAAVSVASGSVFGAGLTGFVAKSNDLGAKLHGISESQQKLQMILATTIDLNTPEADIIEVEDFVFPVAPDVIDGGNF